MSRSLAVQVQLPERLSGEFQFSQSSQRQRLVEQRPISAKPFEAVANVIEDFASDLRLTLAASNRHDIAKGPLSDDNEQPAKFIFIRRSSNVPSIRFVIRFAESGEWIDDQTYMLKKADFK